MMISVLITAIILLLVCGMIIWCVQQIPGLPAPVHPAVSVLIVLAFALWILHVAGLMAM